MKKWKHSLPRRRYLRATGERASLAWVGEGEPFVVEGCIVVHNGQRRWMKFGQEWTFVNDPHNWTICPV